MSNLKYWEDKIKQKRKKTDFREFVMGVASWFNIMFYKNENIICRYPDTNRIKNILEPNKYFQEYGDGVDGISYNFDNSFSENFAKIFINVPKISTIRYGENPNCDFADTLFGAKNTYLSTCIGQDAENILYSVMCYANVRNIFNSVLITSNSENIYFCFQVINSFNIFYSKYITNSNNIWFSSNLTGCTECIFCDGLDNQSYCIENVKYSKEIYLEKKIQILKAKDKFSNFFYTNNVTATNKLSINTNGSGVNFSENVENGFMVNRVKNSRNLAFVDGINNTSDLYDSFDLAESNDIYGWMGCGQGSSNMYIGANASASSNIYYSFFMNNCSFCIGCVGLKNKSYCILNKQYTKEEWYDLADKIFSQMESGGTLGEFFPGELNPFYFNDTMAYLIDDSFTKQEVEKQGYMWRDAEIKVDIPEGVEVIHNKVPLIKGESGSVAETGGFLSDYQGYDSNGNWQINPEILKKVIKDEKGNIYRIVQMEYDFLVKHGLPLPENHWLDRIKMGFKFK
ncbi:MAG: hypothetical protein PHS49_02320 [Candidatus Gracilibacteria bacterium]|nr:hypothetical protein [Candidatus Gracilibacteria bacterium]